MKIAGTSCQKGWTFVLSLSSPWLINPWTKFWNKMLKADWSSSVQMLITFEDQGYRRQRRFYRKRRISCSQFSHCANQKTLQLAETFDHKHNFTWQLHRNWHGTNTFATEKLFEIRLICFLQDPSLRSAAGFASKKENVSGFEGFYSSSLDFLLKILSFCRKRSSKGCCGKFSAP